MLDELRLVSVGGVARASLRFAPGLTAVTGESGAGKSSLVRALELVSGKRSSAGTLRAGDENAVAEAFFSARGRIEGLDDDLQPRDGSFSMRRELSRSGRGRCSVQGRTVPLSVIADAAPALISIQSQFAQLALLDQDGQMKMLDACGGAELSACRRRLETLFSRVLDDERALRGNRLREREVTEKYGALEEIGPVLERLKLEPDSEERLSGEYAAAEKELGRLRALRGRVRLLDDRENGGLLAELRSALGGVASELPEESRDDIADRIARALDELGELASALASLAPAERVENLESEIDGLETTLGLIRKCKRAAGARTAAELIEYRRRGEEELRWLGDLSREQAGLNARAASDKKELARAAKTLRALRLAAAETLEKRVSSRLADLAMESARFRARVTETNKLRASGAEKVDFVIERGGQEIPVAKAASGGELSRLLLALQASLPDELLPPTVVFDEVEAGLGGRAAYLTGLALRRLAGRAQVILITHEASIAALADCHYKVEREGGLSSVRLVTGEARVREIARMLSGDGGDEKALEHARTLLDGARATADARRGEKE